MNEERVAGKDRFAEFHVVGADEIAEPPAAALGQFHHQDAGDLRHRFHLQNAGHDRVAREMAGEKRLVDRDRFHPGAFRLALETEDPIHHQERITMRQELHHLVDIEAAFASGERVRLAGSARCAPNSSRQRPRPARHWRHGRA